VRCRASRDTGGFRAWPLLIAGLLTPLPAFSAAAPQLDSITVQANKEREKLRTEVDQFVGSAIMHYFDRPLLRWQTPVCPLVAGLPRDQEEFILRQLSQIVRNAGAPLAPEKCRANFVVLITSEPDQLLESLRKKRPKLFDIRDGMGTLKHFLRTDRPVRVWYNWQYGADDVALSTAASVTGSTMPSAALSDYPTYRSPNSRLSYSAHRGIETSIIAVDIRRMSGVNLGQLSGYVAMLGLAEIDLDKEILAAPSVLRLFSEAGGTPVDGMSLWDQMLLKCLYATRSTDVQQISQIETQMVDAIVRH
jgi:hypothetical protein